MSNPWKAWHLPSSLKYLGSGHMEVFSMWKIKWNITSILVPFVLASSVSPEVAIVKVMSSLSIHSQKNTLLPLSCRVWVSFLYRLHHRGLESNKAHWNVVFGKRWGKEKEGGAFSSIIWDEWLENEKYRWFESDVARFSMESKHRRSRKPIKM